MQGVIARKHGLDLGLGAGAGAGVVRRLDYF